MCSKSLFKLVILIFVLSFFGGLPGFGDSLSLKEKGSLVEFRQHYKELIKYYEKLIKTSSANLELKIELANFYYDFRDYQKVKKLLGGIDFKEARIILAKALVKLKEYDYAIEIFEQLKPLPEDSEYLYLYGELLEEKNLFPKAIKIYSKVKGIFANLAGERIRFIKTNTEDSVPSGVLKVSQEAENFFNQVEDEAGMILFVDEEIEIISDNTSLSVIHVIEKVLKDRGKELAEVEVGYDSTYERVELEFARTITKDGRVIYAGKENIRDVSRYLNFPLYSNSRAFIVSMPSVDVGAFIEYKIKIYSSKLIDEDNFSFAYQLREKYPVFKANFRLVVPETQKARFRFVNRKYAEGINFQPLVTEKEGKKIYTWKFNQIKSIIPEYGMPPYSLVNPAILVSSFSSWEQVYKWWYSLYHDKINLSRETKDFVKNIIKDISGRQDKAKKIYEYVAKNIRYVAIEYGDSGYEPHHAQDVFTNRYGDCKDQAVLLVAMLRTAGLEAYPVLISTRKAYSIDKNFPSLNFNHAICVLKIDDDLIFMDPTAETTPFSKLPLSDQDRTVMVFFDSGWQIINTPQFKENEVRYDMEIVINNEENAEIMRKVTTKGFFASGYRWYLKYTHPAVIKENIQKKMMEISSLSCFLGYKIKNADDLDSFPVLTYKFTAEKLLNPAGNLRIVPVLDQIYLDHSLISKEKRNFPVDFEGFYTKAGKIRIVLPENLKIKHLPSSRVLENLWFKLMVSYENHPGYIDFYQKFTTKKRFVEEEEYQEFKTCLEDALYLLREEIILEKAK